MNQQQYDQYQVTQQQHLYDTIKNELFLQHYTPGGIRYFEIVEDFETVYAPHERVFILFPKNGADRNGEIVDGVTYLQQTYNATVLVQTIAFNGRFIGIPQEWKRPCNYYFYIAQECIKQAYSPAVAGGFYVYTLRPAVRHMKPYPKSYREVECFNGGAFVVFRIYDDGSGIQQRGMYELHRKYNKRAILDKANRLRDNGALPPYTSAGDELRLR